LFLSDGRGQKSQQRIIGESEIQHAMHGKWKYFDIAYSDLPVPASNVGADPLTLDSAGTAGVMRRCNTTHQSGKSSADWSNNSTIRQY